MNPKKHIQFIKNLAERKRWEIKLELLSTFFQRPHLRFVYCPITLSDGKKAFFKYAPSSSLFSNLEREREFLLFFQKKLPGLAPKVLDFGHSWVLFEFLEKGVICEGEKTSVLKLKWAEKLVKTISRLQNFSPPFPKKLLDLSRHQKNYDNLEKVKKIILERISFLKKNNLPTPLPYQKIEKFIEGLEEERGRRIVVHGDLAPNNVFFAEDGRVIFLDWEYVSLNPNLTLASTFDFANFYLRCWQNPKFQKHFRERFLETKVSRSRLTLGVVFLGVSQLYHLWRKREEEKEYLKRHISALTDKIREELLGV